MTLTGRCSLAAAATAFLVVPSLTDSGCQRMWVPFRKRNTHTRTHTHTCTCNTSLSITMQACQGWIKMGRLLRGRGCGAASQVVCVSASSVV